MMRLLVLLPLGLVAGTAFAAGPMIHGGALDPVSASIAMGLGGVALWKARAARA